MKLKYIKQIFIKKIVKITIMKKKFVKEDFRKVRNPAAGPITFQPFSRASPYIGPVFANYFPFTPNQITFIWEIIQLFGIFLIALGGYRNMLMGIVIYHLAFFLDYIDGDLARVIKKTTVGGAYLDKFFHYFNRSLLLIALGIGVYNSPGDKMYLFLGIWSAIFLLFDSMGKLKVYEAMISVNKVDLMFKEKEAFIEEGGTKKENGVFKTIKRYTIELLRPANPFSLIFFAILFNFPHYYLIFFAVLTPIIFISSFIKIYRRIGNTPF